MNRFILLLVFLSVASGIYAQQTSSSITRIDPTNWWTGMKNPDLQLMVYGTNAGTLTYTINYPGVQLVKVNKVENPNYAFIDLRIAPGAKPGMLKIVGKSGSQLVSRSYELKARTTEAKGAGLTAADLVYLIMPDRFANGDTTNDKYAGLADTLATRMVPYLRHGGDFKGLIDHLDYPQEMGATAIWLTPVLVNDETLKLEGPERMQAGYHGYHFTDHYQVDPRFGGNAGYLQFSKALHKQGLKLVQDAVYNHISEDHWFYKDLPSKDWINNWPAYTGTSHKEQALYDEHASEADKQVFSGGGFTSFLPDLNQRNPFLAKYLIQHAIWCTETFDVDAWRIDTYKYNDQAFMNACNKALMAEYPNIYLFGETTAGNPLGLSYFVRNNMNFAFKSNLPGTNDFPLNNAILNALNEKYGFDEGVNRIYQTLAGDVVYADPMKMATQIDNHDMDRFYSVIGEDFDKFKIGITWLLTLRGIPTWYYGTELLMKNVRSPSDAEVRKDFPGGFPGDKENKFTAEGRSKQENEAFNFVKTLANYRKNTPSLSNGKLMQYLPQDGIYIYFRYDAAKTIMIATNTNGNAVQLDTARFAERMKGYNGAKNIITNEIISNLSAIAIPAKTALVLELTK